jgi:hypothetical protein
MSRVISVVAWFFLVRSAYYSSPFTVVGPFKSQIQCEAYRKNIVSQTYPCWIDGS